MAYLLRYFFYAKLSVPHFSPFAAVLTRIAEVCSASLTTLFTLIHNPCWRFEPTIFSSNATNIFDSDKFPALILTRMDRIDFWKKTATFFDLTPPPSPTPTPSSYPTSLLRTNHHVFIPPSFSHLSLLFPFPIPFLHNSAPPSTLATPEPGSSTIFFWNTKFIAPTIKRFVIFYYRKNRFLTPQVTSLEPAGLRVLWQDDDGDRFDRAPPHSLELEVGMEMPSNRDKIRCPSSSLN